LAEKSAREARKEKEEQAQERQRREEKAAPKKGDWVSSLTPDEKFAYDYLRETDPDKKQSMLDEFEAAKFEAEGATDPDTIKVPRSGPKRQAALEAKEQATLAWNRAISRVQDESQKLIGGVYSKMRENEAPESRGKAPAAAASPGAAASGLPRSSRTAEIRRIKRRFVQSKAGLTDEQTAAITDDEIDRAYFAFNSQADEKKAAAAQDAVVSVAAGVEQFTALNSANLLQEYYKEIDAALKAGDMDRVRNANFKELVRLGAFRSTREFLSRLADKNNKAPRDLQIRAKAFLNLEKRGYKLENIEIQAANFRKTGTTERSRWGGLLGRDADYSKFGIYLNLDQAHDRASIANTALHELAHATTLAKVHGKIKTTKEEQKAVSDLEAMRRRALLRAGDASPTIKAAADAAGITDPKERSDFYQKAIATLVNNDPAFRDFNGLKNLDEFIVEITGSPDFLKLLGKLGFGKADQEKRTFTGMVRDAFLAILKLLGTDINPNSELGRAFFDSWNLWFFAANDLLSRRALSCTASGACLAAIPLRKFIGRLQQGACRILFIQEIPGGLSHQKAHRNPLGRRQDFQRPVNSHFFHIGHPQRSVLKLVGHLMKFVAPPDFSWRPTRSGHRGHFLSQTSELYRE
jgi:hypothetical protein